MASNFVADIFDTKLKEMVCVQMLEPVRGALNGLSQIDDLLDVDEEVSRCFPPDYNIVAFYESRYRKMIKV